MSTALEKSFVSRPGDETGWGFLLSLGVHLLLAALIVFWPGWGPGKREIFAPVYQVKLVGPPDLPAGPAGPPSVAPKPKPEPPKPAPKPEQPKAEPAPKPAPKPSPKPKEAIGDKESVKTKRLERKKTAPVDTGKDLEDKIKRLKAKVAEERRLDDVLDRLENKVSSRAKVPAVASNSGGGGGGGGGGSQVSMRFQIYYTELWERIRRHWVLPEALVAQPRGLEAVLVMRIRKNGELEKVWLEQGSGNSHYDQSCLRAVEKAAPFPPLPPGMREAVHEVGVRFKPNDLSG